MQHSRSSHLPAPAPAQAAPAGGPVPAPPESGVGPSGTAADAQPPIPTIGVQLTEFQDRMQALARAVQELDLRTFEARACAGEWQDLHAIAAQLVAEARELVGGVLEACEAHRAVDSARGDGTLLSQPYLPFELALDAMVETAAASTAAVEDVAFLVLLELRQRSERLARLSPATAVVAAMGECDSALRRIRKGMGAVELTIARATGSPPRLDFASELQDSLRVRAAYGKLRATLTQRAAPSDAELYARLRAAGTHFAIVVGWDAYPLLRIGDRLQLLDLQRRILSWLHPDHRSELRAGHQLWSDVCAFVELLREVNRRHELVVHDTELLRRVLTELPEAGSEAEAAPVGPDVLSALQALMGRDAELDSLLGEAAAPAGRALRDALSQLAATLAPSQSWT